MKGRYNVDDLKKPRRSRARCLIDTNAYWLIGGLIGAVIGVRLSFDLICKFTSKNPDFCQSIIRICTILIIILIIFGTSGGVVVGNIIYYLREIFSKSEKPRST